MFLLLGKSEPRSKELAHMVRGARDGKGGALESYKLLKFISNMKTNMVLHKDDN